MKKLIFLIFILTCSMSAQEDNQAIGVNCITRASHTQTQRMPNITPAQLHVQTGAYDTDIGYCIKVYAHKLTKSNGTMGVSDSYIAAQISYLNANFGGGFTFVWDGTINTVADTNIFNTNIVVDQSNVGTYDFNPLGTYSTNDGVDIFFSSRFFGAAGVANGKADQSEIIMSLISDGGNSPDGIIHEVGHVFGLFHTYHSTFGNGIQNPENADGLLGPTGQLGDSHVDLVECPNQSEVVRRGRGDFVSDTPADRKELTGINQTNCTASGQGDSPTASCGMDFFPPISYTNYMKDTPYFHSMSCNKEFTPGQYQRMKFFLSNQNFPHMNLLLDDCPVDPDPCDSCEGAETGSNNIVNSFEMIDCDSVSLEISGLYDSCNEIRVFWDNNPTDFTVLTPNVVEQHVYNQNGDYVIRIEVWRNEQECESAERFIDVTVDCEVEPTCDDCDTLGAQIFDSLNTDTCGVYTLDIPDGTLDCYDVVVITDFGASTTLEESDIINEVFEFTYDENGNYPFAVSLFIPGTFDRCHYSKGGIPVKCIVDTTCDWPKTIGTNNPADSPLILQEYVNAVAEDIDGNIVTLGRAKIGADIEGQSMTSESYAAKYDECGTLISLINLPMINYPLQMELQKDKGMIVLSSDLAPINNASYARNVFLDKIDSTGNHLWRVSINAHLINLFRDISFTLNRGNNDVYLQLPRQSLALNGAFVTDSSGYNYKPKRSVVMKFNTNGLLKWKEEIPYTNTATFVAPTQTLDVDYDESNEMLRVLFSGYEGYVAHLEASNVNIPIEDVTPPATPIRTLVVQYSVNNANVAPVFDSSFPTVIENSSYNQKWIVNNGTYTYISQQEGDVFVYDNAGNYVNEFLLNHKIGDLTHRSGTNSIYTFGVGLGTNTGLGVTSFNNAVIEWSDIIPVNSFPEYAFPLDMVVTNQDKIFLTGVFDNSNATFESNIGGSDGFILRLVEENGTIVSGLTDDASNEVVVKSSHDNAYSLRIYPNPFSDQFAIDSSKGAVIKQVEVYNAFGILLHSQPYTNGETIYFSKGATGIYFARVYMENGDVQIINLIKK